MESNDQQRLSKLKEYEMYKSNFYKKTDSKQEFISNFTQMSTKLNEIQKHMIRKIILQKFPQRQSVQLYDKNKEGKSIQTGFDAVALKNCTKHHITHINDFCQQFFRQNQEQEKKKFTYLCNQCSTWTQKITDVYPDAYAISYINFINKIGQTQAVFLKVQEKQDQVLKKIDNGEQLLTIRGKNNIIQMFILNKRKQGLAILELANKIQKLQKNKQIYNQFLQKISKYLYEVNLFCFHQKKRINNPLIHKDCSDHKKICIFSFDYVLNQIQNNKSVRCFYPQCNNQFNKQNFQKVAIISQQIRRNFYSEKKYLSKGQFRNKQYNKNSQQRQVINKLQKLYSYNQVKHRQNYKNITQECILIIKNMSIRRRDPNNQKYQKLIGQYKSNNISRYINVKVSNNIFSNSPVRCIKCPDQNIQIYDMWEIVGNFQFKDKKFLKCLRCLTQKQPLKHLYDYYFIDIRFAKFLFLQGLHTNVYFDCATDSFVRKLQSFKGNQLKQKLIFQDKIQQKDLSRDYSTLEVIIQEKNAQNIPFVHQTCFQSKKLKSYFFAISNYPIQQTICKACKDYLYVDDILFDQQLFDKMKKHKNNFSQMGNQKGQNFTQQQIFDHSIQQLKKLQLLKLPFLKKSTVNIYLKSYYFNKLIDDPIAFTRCTHPPQTRICSLNDLIQTRKLKQSNVYRCRYSKCYNQYTRLNQIFYVKNFDVQNLKNIKNNISNHNFWFSYNVQTNSLIIVGDQQSKLLSLETQFYRKDPKKLNIDPLKIKRKFKVSYQEIISGERQGNLSQKQKQKNQNQKIAQKSILGKILSAGNTYFPKIFLQCAANNILQK